MRSKPAELAFSPDSPTVSVSRSIVAAPFKVPLNSGGLRIRRRSSWIGRASCERSKAALQSALNADQFLQAAELRKLRDELRTIHRIQWILILELCDKNLQELI